MLFSKRITIAAAALFVLSSKIAFASATASNWTDFVEEDASNAFNAASSQHDDTPGAMFLRGTGKNNQTSRNLFEFCCRYTIPFCFCFDTSGIELCGLESTERVGGSGGSGFNDCDAVEEVDSPRIRQLILYGGVGAGRVEGIETRLTTGEVFLHGSRSGYMRLILPYVNEYIQYAQICYGAEADPSIYYAKFTTNLARSVEIGFNNGRCENLFSGSNHHFVGNHGSDGNSRINGLGMIKVPIS